MNAKFLLNGSLLLCASLIAMINASNDTQLQKRVNVLEIDKFKETKKERLGRIQCTLHAIGIVPKENDDVTIIRVSNDEFTRIDARFSQLEILQNHTQFIDNYSKSWLPFKKSAWICQKNSLNLEIVEHKKNANRVYGNFLQIKSTDIPSVEQLPEEYNKLKTLQKSVSTLHSSGLGLIKKCEDFKHDAIESERLLLVGFLYVGAASLFLIAVSGKSKR